MREIKFRAWDNINKRYYRAVLIDNYLEVEQYTGINDKNGVEIYEGDIIDTHWGNEENRLVKYDDEMGFYLTPDLDQHYWTVAYRGEYEVIGNIHENADLLEEQS